MSSNTDRQKNKRLMVMAGGTGGHVFMVWLSHIICRLKDGRFAG